MNEDKAKYRGTPEYLLVYDALTKAAKERGFITYTWIAKTMGLPPRGHHMSREVGQMLFEIAQEERKAGRPMLSALARNATGGMGPGFFALARDVGKLQDEDEAAFLAAEQEAVYTAWSSEQHPRDAAPGGKR